MKINAIINPDEYLGFFPMQIISGAVCEVLMEPLLTIIHEGGHLIAAAALFENAKPRLLSSWGYQNGKMAYNPSKLSRLGKIFGENTSRGLVTASGPLADILVSLVVPYATGSKVYATTFSIYMLCEIQSIYRAARRRIENDYLKVAHRYGFLPFATLLTLSVSTSCFVSLKAFAL